MAFATLTEAAQKCSGTMFTRWRAGTLRANLQTFAADITGTFSDDIQNDRTVGDWLVPIQAITPQFGNIGATTEDQIFRAVVLMIFQICVETSNRSGTGQITVGQSAVVLAAMNASLS